MNAKRLVIATLVAGVVRTVINGLYYGVALKERFTAIGEAHPGVFREVVPAYITADFLYVLVFVVLFAKVGSSLGGGVTGGAKLGLFLGILGPAIGVIYWHFTLTLYTTGLVVCMASYELVAHVLVGALVGALYKE